MRTHSKENEKLGKIFFLICIILMIVANSVFGQQLSRSKFENKWYPYKMISFDQNKDSVLFGAAFYPGPYDFDRIFVELTSDTCGVNYIMAITYQDNLVDYVSSYNSYNCSGSLWFLLSDTEKNHLKTKKIKDVKITNPLSKKEHVITGWDELQYYNIVLNN